MSVGDIKGCRRRRKMLYQKGHLPQKSGISVSESIERNRRIAQKMQKMKAGSKKR